MREIYVSTGAFTPDRLEEVFSLARSWGVENIELSSGVPYEPDVPSLIEKHKDDFRFLVHNYFPAPKKPFVLNLAANDPQIREKSLDHCRRALELTVDLGAPFYAVHAGFAFHPTVEQLGSAFEGKPAMPRERAYEIFLENVREILKYARSLGVSFYVENNVVAPFNAPEGKNDRVLLADPDEMIRFAEDIDDPSFGYLMDVGHLNVSAKTLGFDRNAAIDVLMPFIRAFHLSDNDGTEDSNKPFGADAWFLPWLSRCPQSTIVIEAYELSPQQLNRCLDAVSQAVER